MNSTYRLIIVLFGAALMLLFINLGQHAPDALRALPGSGALRGGSNEMAALAALVMIASALRTLFRRRH